MKRFLLLSAFVLVAVLSFSCDQETNLSIAPDVDSFSFGTEGGSFDVVVFTNGYWKASCPDASVTCSPDTGNFTTPMHVVVGPNTEPYTKSMRITLTSNINGNSRSARIAITQGCKPFLMADPAEGRIGREGGTARFSVNSNFRWQLAGITLDGEPDEGTARLDPVEGGPNRTEVALRDIPENTDGRPRAFRLTLVLADHPEVSLVLTVFQEG